MSVEISAGPGDSILVRNSKDPGGPVLRFTFDEWDAFCDGVDEGEFTTFNLQYGHWDHLQGDPPR